MLTNRTPGEYVYEMSGQYQRGMYGRIEAAGETETISASSGPCDETL